MGRTDVSSPLLSPTTSMGIQDGYEKPMDGLMVGPAKKKNERLKSLDAMRGLTVSLCAFMMCACRRLTALPAVHC